MTIQVEALQQALTEISANVYNWERDAIRSVADKALATVSDAFPSLEQAITERQLAELDELGAEVARLQKAIAFWLPSVTDREDEVACRILEDAFLLVGYDGDEKSAQELGWIQFASPSPVSVQPSDDAKDCLHDVISHYDDFRSACGTRGLDDLAKYGPDSMKYWEHQQKVLDRMKAQAERALSTQPAQPKECDHD